LATGWLRTKDLGYYDKGSVSVIGSISPTVRIQEKIFPTKAIEDFLETETVRKARILPLLHAKNTWRPCLFLLKNDTWVKYREIASIRDLDHSSVLPIGDLKLFARSTHVSFVCRR